jgi:hypothetical protein
MALVEVQCEICGKVFLRKKGEVNRSKRLGRRFFCSLECTGIANRENVPPELVLKNLRRGSVATEFSPFRGFYKIIKNRVRVQGDPLSLTLLDLKLQWEAQQGICPLTGWEMELPPTSNWSDYPLTPYRASIDRVDSSQGYVSGNIRFVSVMANYCKHIFTDEDVLEFCRAVVAYQGKKP